MTEVSSLLSQSPIDGDAKVLSVTKYTGLHLEPPTRDVVSQTKTAKKTNKLLNKSNAICGHKKPIDLNRNALGK